MARSVFVCSACGHESPRWHGRCPGCGDWNSLVEERSAPVSEGRARGGRGKSRGALRPVPLAEVEAPAVRRLSTGIGELDRVLGGGLVPGSLVLLGGEPGIGKSTLLLQAAAGIADDGGAVLYATGEESA